MGTFVKPFRTGDVVRGGWDRKDKGKGEDHIIHECQVEEINHYKYSTTRGAWFPHTYLSLVRECDAESMNALIDHLQAEEE
jgi:hypothetical protein